MPQIMKEIKTKALTALGLLAVFPAFAQEEGQGLSQTLENMDSNQVTLLIILGVVLGLIILLLGLLVFLISFMKSLIKTEAAKEGISISPVLLKDSADKDREEGKVGEKVLEDHSYDGIKELDNFMPPWLQYVFVLSIGFGIVYFINYSVLGLGKTQLEEYQEELQVAEVQAEARKLTAVSTIDETNVVFDKTEASLESGKAIFDNNCVACHASDGGGGVGPNLTDEYWLHGGAIEDVFKVVKYGVPEKGMIPWQDQLEAEEMQQVSSYILTLSGSTPVNPKEPQGEKYEPVIEEPVDVLKGAELGLEEAEGK